MRPKRRDFTKWDIGEGIAANGELTCSVRNCEATRVKLSALCGKHLRRQKSWGHHTGRFIRPRELEPWIGSARKFIAEQSNHRGIQLALKWFKLRIERAEPPVVDVRTSPHAELQLKLVLLKSAGVEPEECLARCIAVWMCAHHLQNVEPEVVARNLASHVFYSMAPGCRASKASTKKLFGNQIFDAFLHLFVRIVQYYDAKVEAAFELYEGSQEPFAGEQAGGPS